VYSRRPRSTARPPELCEGTSSRAPIMHLVGTPGGRAFAGTRRRSARRRRSAPRWPTAATAPFLSRLEAPLALAINPDVIHQHLLRKHSARVGRSGQVSAHRDVEDQKERVVEGPKAARWQVDHGPGRVDLVVDREAHAGAVPVDGE